MNKRFRPLTNWAIMGAKGEATMAGPARWYMGSEHSVLGVFSIAQCERMDRRINALLKKS